MWKFDDVDLQQNGIANSSFCFSTMSGSKKSEGKMASQDLNNVLTVIGPVYREVNLFSSGNFRFKRDD
jgi:hypothetical protein